MRKGQTGGVYVRLFGGPQLLRDSRTLTLSPHQSCLLALAYGSGEQGISRAEAAWLLWEADDSPAARHRISQLLYGIRKRVEARCIDDTAIDAVIGTLVCDVSEFHRLLGERKLGELRATTEREFLSELVAPTPSFAHWVDGKRAAFRRAARDTAASDLATSEAAGDWKRVAQAAELLLAIDPVDEGVLRRLLQAFALSASRVELDAALRSYAEQYRTATGERWIPERATSMLLARIDQVERVSLHRSAAPLPTLVGRAKELQQLHRALSTRNGAVQFTVVAGEAGIGKTRLIREVLTRLKLEGYTVLESGSSQLQRELPLHSLLGALSDPRVLERLKDLEEPWKSSLTVLLPHLPLEPGITPPTLDPQATSRRLMEALYQLLGQIASQGRTVLFLDDLQWLDKTTLCAMEFLSERTPAVDVQVVFATRSEAESEVQVKPFLDTIRRSGTWIELDELDQAAADSLLAESAPRPLMAVEREELRRFAGRSPFFLIEIVNEYCRSHPDREEVGSGLGIPTSIRQLLAARLEKMPREARTLLELLSVAGELSVDAPVPLNDLPAFLIPDIADDLLRARLVQHRNGVIGIRHDLIRQTAYELTGPIKKSILHRRTAEAILGRPGEIAHGEVAIHFDRAGDKARAFEHATLAALNAQSHGAVPEAIRFWETALRNASASTELADASKRLAELLYEARRLQDAVPLLEAASNQSDGDDRERYAILRLDAVSEIAEERQQACLDEIEYRIDQAKASESWRLYAEAVEVRLRILDRLHWVDKIRSQLLEVRELVASGAITSEHTLCLAHSILSLSAFYLDDDAGLADASKALDLALTHNISTLLLRAYHRKLFCYMLRGQLHKPEGLHAIQEALEWAARSGDLRSRATIHNNCGCYCLDTGDFAQAARFFREAETLVCGPSERAMVYGNLGELSYCQGEIQRAEEYFRKANAEVERHPVSGFISIVVLAGLGLCALDSGRFAAAQGFEARIRRALEGEWVHDPYLVVRFLAELDRRRGRVSEAVELIRARVIAEKRRPIYRMRMRMLEIRYLRLLDLRAADKLESKLKEENAALGLPRMIN